ncbi:hypothetical protein AAC387_Pa01g4202 [Persea americana]
MSPASETLVWIDHNETGQRSESGLKTAFQFMGGDRVGRFEWVGFGGSMRIIRNHGGIEISSSQPQRIFDMIL